MSTERTLAKLRNAEIYLLGVGEGAHGLKVRILDRARGMLGPVQWLDSVLAHVHGEFVEVDEPVASDLLREVRTRTDLDVTGSVT